MTTFYTSGTYSVGDVGDIRTFFSSLAALFPNTITISVPGAGDVINDTDGSLAGSWSEGSTPAVVVGTSASGYAAPAGMLVRWNTDAVIRKRRLRGRTFLVPVANVFEPGGTPLAATITTITTAANTLVTALGGAMRVWSRPLIDYSTDPPTHLADGTGAPVVSVLVPDKAVVLRSRRD